MTDDALRRVVREIGAHFQHDDESTVIRNSTLARWVNDLQRALEAQEAAAPGGRSAAEEAFLAAAHDAAKYYDQLTAGRQRDEWETSMATVLPSTIWHLLRAYRALQAAKRGV